MASLDLLNSYLARINTFGPAVFDAAELPDLMSAYNVLSAATSDPVALLKKQLLAAELNFMNGAFFESPEVTATKLLLAEKMILDYQAGSTTVTADELLKQKDLFDAFNNMDLLNQPEE